MQLSHNMVRLRPSDIERLSIASVKLAEIATTIQGTKSTWASLAVQGLREVNETIVELRDRALAKMVRIAEKNQDEIDAAARSRAGGDENA